MGAYLKERNPSPECEYLETKEVAKSLGVCPQFIYENLGTPRCPPYVRIGRILKFPKDKFREWKRQLGEKWNV
jgi:predicted DNA-binding transcriptional regulator AlpA